MRGLLGMGLMLLSACSPRSVAVVVELPSGASGDAAYEVRLHAGACPSSLEDVLAGRPTGAIRTLRWRAGETPERIGSQDGADYSVSAIVRDGACQPVYFGCAIYGGSGDELRVSVTDVAASAEACPASETCDRGLCEGEGPDAGPDGPDAGPDPDGGLDDPDADVSECSTPTDCAPTGLGRCDMGRCAPCAPTVLPAQAFPDATAGFGDEVALEAYEVLDAPWSWVVLRDNAGPAHLWHRQVPISDHMNTTQWFVPIQFDTFDPDETGGGPDVIEPDSFALLRDADLAHPDIWIAAIAEVGGVQEVISGRMFGGWRYRNAPASFPIGPGFMTRQFDGQPRFGWRGALDAGGATLRALRANDLIGPTEGMVVISETGRGNVSGSDGNWMVASEGTSLHFWTPESATAANTLVRTDGDGPAALAFEGGETFLIAYADGSTIRVRRMICSGRCGFDPERPADAVIERSVPVSFVRLAIIPGGGAVVAWVEADTNSRVFAQVLPDRLGSPGVVTHEVASIASREVRDLQIDTLVHRSEVYVPMVLVAGPAGSGADFGSYFGLRYRQDLCP